MTPTISERQMSEARRWVREPIYWARKFGGEHFDPWSGQEEFWIEYGKLLNAKLKKFQNLPMTEEEKRYAKKFGISIKAGQGLGKGATISLAAYHYQFVLQTYRTKAVCTAPAGPQLLSSLWPEFGAWLQRSPLLNDLFEKNAKRIWLKEDQDEGTVSRIEPRTVAPEADPEKQKVVLAGVHALGVLYLIDEASGVPEAVFEPIEGGLTDPLSMVILIYNPTKRDGFAIETHRKNREMWICLHWDGEALAKEKAENPGRFNWFNEEQQVTLAKKYGRDSDFYRVRIRGMEPNHSGDTLIAFESAMMATTRVVETLPHDPIVHACDVGGPNRGGDKSVLVSLRGPKMIRLQTYTEKNGVQLAQLMSGHMADDLSSLESGVQEVAGVDTNGIGQSTYDHLRDVQMKKNVRRINTAELATNPQRYHRLRDQIYWELREAFMETLEISLMITKNGVVQVNDELIAQLTSIKWHEGTDGKIKIQGKGLESGIPQCPPLKESPDEADALAMAWYLYKHCTSRIPPAFREKRRQRNLNTMPALVGMRSIGSMLGRMR